MDKSFFSDSRLILLGMKHQYFWVSRLCHFMSLVLRMLKGPPKPSKTWFWAPTNRGFCDESLCFSVFFHATWKKNNNPGYRLGNPPVQCGLCSGTVAWRELPQHQNECQEAEKEVPSWMCVLFLFLSKIKGRLGLCQFFSHDFSPGGFGMRLG